MKQTSEHCIVVVGNGVAGVSAALGIRQHSKSRIVIISDESEYFFSRTGLMYVYMGHLQAEDLRPYAHDFWKQRNIELLHDKAERIDTGARRLYLHSGNAMSYDTVVIATGSRSYIPMWPGTTAAGVQALYSLNDLESMQHYTRSARRAVVVGGGLIGVEAAEMLHSRGIQTSLLVRESRYWGNVLPAEEAALVERHIRSHGIELRTSTQLQALTADSAGRVRSVVTTQGDELPCEFVLIATGVHPNTELAERSGIACRRGVVVDEYFRTNAPSVYAIGDCAEIEAHDGTSRVESLWYTARAHGNTVAETILGRATPYKPGVFFNSAKFFDIEYQTYGAVPALPAAGEHSLYRESPCGTQALRIAYTDGGVTGFNLLGIRFRQDICSQWIEEKRSLNYVLQHLRKANFQEELTKHQQWLWQPSSTLL